MGDALTAPIWMDNIAKIFQVDGPKIALVEACYYRNISAVSRLLENGADPNFFIKGRRSPLEAVLSNGPAGPVDEKSYVIVEMLLKAGADVNRYSLDEPIVIQLSSAMVLDAQNPVKEKILCLLLDHGADREYKGYDYVFHNIVCSGNVALAGRIIDTYGADVNEIGYNSQTPLILAVSYSHNSATVEMVEMLLLRGADTRCVDKNGKTAIDWARERDLREIVELLSNQT